MLFITNHIFSVMKVLITTVHNYVRLIEILNENSFMGVIRNFIKCFEYVLYLFVYIYIFLHRRCNIQYLAVHRVFKIEHFGRDEINQNTNIRRSVQPDEITVRESVRENRFLLIHNKWHIEKKK